MAVYKLSTAGGAGTARTNYNSFLAGNPKYEAGSYFSIATVNITGNTSFAEFANIPNTYKHLQIRGIARLASGSQYCQVSINGDTTASNYNYHAMEGDGTNALSFESTSYRTPFAQAGSTANNFQPTIIDILDYTSINKFKTFRGLFGQEYNGSGNITLVSGIWRSSSVIDTIRITPNNSANFAQYTQFALYGIKED